MERCVEKGKNNSLVFHLFYRFFISSRCPVANAFHFPLLLRRACVLSAAWAALVRSKCRQDVATFSCQIK